MAYIQLATPGSTPDAPCEDTECGHTDCAYTRSIAQATCPLCGEPCGYERNIQRLPVTGEWVHRVCLLSAVERGTL